MPLGFALRSAARRPRGGHASPPPPATLDFSTPQAGALVALLNEDF